MSSEYTRLLIAEIIESFDFSDYGMDDVDEVKKFGAGRAEWLKDLSAAIADGLDISPKKEAVGKARLVDTLGTDHGEISDVEFEESYPGTTLFRVWTKTAS